MILELFGYDRRGEIKECKTTLAKNALNIGRSSGLVSRRAEHTAPRRVGRH